MLAQLTKQIEAKRSLSHYFTLLFILCVVQIWIMVPVNNQTLFFGINELSLHLPQTSLALITDFGNGITLGAVILCYLAKRPELSCRVLLAVLFSLIMVPLLKQHFDAPRPLMVHNMVSVIGAPRYHHSFPSGHTASIFLFAGLIYFCTQRIWLRWTLLLLAVFVGTSRVLVGAHWPEDVVMGAIVGLSLAYAATRICPLIYLSHRKKALVYLAIIILLVISEINTDHDFPDHPLVQYVRWSLIGASGLMISRFWLLEQLNRLYRHSQRQRSLR